MASHADPTGSLDTALAHARRLLDGQPDLALAQAREILRVVPRSASALMIAGAAHRMKGEGDLATAAFRAATAADPGSPEAWRALGDQLHLAEDEKGGDAAYLAALRASTRDPALLQAADALARNALAEAEPILRNRLKEEPTDIGESVVVMRGPDGSVSAFHNVCRHRGARILDGARGCAKRIVCPYHAWTYASDGRLVGVPMKDTYDPGALDGIRLAPIEHEIWQGFIFVRLEGGGPSVAEMMQPYDHEVAPYRFEELQALGRVTLRERRVNWKNIADNYSDGLHIAVAHPGLKRLMGDGYGVESAEWVDKMWGPLVDRPSSNPSERAYCHFLPKVAHLPDERQRLWVYFKLWPNVAFDIYPDQVDFMQFLPLSPTETMIREISYAIPDDRREMKAARYLNWRINRQVNAEDTELVGRVQQGMASSSFSVGPLSKGEVALRNFCRRTRDLIPEAREHAAPPLGWSRAYR